MDMRRLEKCTITMHELHSSMSISQNRCYISSFWPIRYSPWISYPPRINIYVHPASLWYNVNQYTATHFVPDAVLAICWPPNLLFPASSVNESRIGTASFPYHKYCWENESVPRRNIQSSRLVVDIHKLHKTLMQQDSLNSSAIQPT